MNERISDVRLDAIEQFPSACAAMSLIEQRELVRGYREMLSLHAAQDGLWCLHIIGPDDVHPAPNRALAEYAAEQVNARFGDTSKQVDVMFRAEAAPWPHSAESHAESVGNFITDFLVPASALKAAPAGAASAKDASNGNLLPLSDDDVDAMFAAAFKHSMCRARPNREWWPPMTRRRLRLAVKALVERRADSLEPRPAADGGV